jgi:hypothetical protein
MATVTKTRTYSTGDTLTASNYNADRDEIIDGVNSVVNAQISASAAIDLSKLATGALPTAITIASANIVDGTIVNADISASAAIAYSKLTLTGSIVNADVSASAAIALSKLATGALPTGITIASANIVDGAIVNVDINASAAIAYSKLSLTGAILNADLAGSISASKISDTAVTLTASQTLTNKTLTTPIIASISNSGTVTIPTGTNTLVGRATTDTLTNKTLTSPAINTPTTTGPSATITTATDGATVTFNLSNGPIHTVTLGGNRTLALSNSAAGKVFVLRLVQDGTGSRTVTWFSTIKWTGGSAPTLTTTASKIDVFGFICSATNVYDGYIVGQNLS